MSFGAWSYIGLVGNTAYLWDNDNVTHISDTATTGGTYRGASHTVANPINWRENYGFRGWDRGVEKNGIMSVPRHFPSIDADIKSLVDAGMILCIAAGNDNNKYVNPGDDDYDNNFVFTNGATHGLTDNKLYYMRADTPNFNGGDNSNNIPGLMVGALDTTPNSSTHDRKGDYSCTGSAVNVYTAGTSIKSSTKDSVYTTMTGTSMASPQICGICALLLQVHPEWTPKQVMNWITNNATDKMYSAGSTDFTDNYSLLGGQAKVAYFPMNGQKPFTISGS